MMGRDMKDLTMDVWKDRITSPWVVQIGRNSSWRDSMRLLIRRVWFYFPLKVCSVLRNPALVLLIGLWTVPIMTISLILYFVVATVAGLFGCLSDPLIDETPPRDP